MSTLLRKIRGLIGPVAIGSAWSLGIKLLGLGVGFAYAVLAARVLGPAGYGVFAVVTSIASIAATVSLLGLGPLSVRKISQCRAEANWSELRGFVRASRAATLVASALGGASLGLLGLGLADIVSPTYRSELAAAALLVPCMSLVLLYQAQLRGMGRVVMASAPFDLVRTGSMVVVLALVLGTSGHLEPLTCVGLLVAATVAALLAVALSLRAELADEVPSAAASRLPRGWLRQGVPFLLITLAAIAHGKLTTVLLGSIADARAAGLFQPIASLTPIMLIGFEAVCFPLAPRLAELWHAGEVGRVRHNLALAVVVSTLVTGAIAGVIVWLSPVILAVFGDSYVANWKALGWIAAAQVAGALCGPAGLFLAMAGRERLALIGRVSSLAVELGLGLVLIGPYGVEGAALAMAGSILAWNLVSLIAARRCLGIDTSLVGAIRHAWRAARAGKDG